MNTIASTNNPRLKDLRKLRRRRERERSGLFAAEGEDLIAAALAAGRPAVAGYRLAGTAIGGSGFTDVEPSAMASVSALGSGTRAIAVYEQRFTEPTGPLCVCLWGVSDPGNVGTVLRGALAFGAACVALGPGCADPHSPKAVRASMGAIFAVALARVGDVGELPGRRVALAAGAGEPIWSVAGARIGAGSAEPSALTLLVGGEREGLPDEVLSRCDRVAHIPIASESLNAAMAATVALYEITRQASTEEGSGSVASGHLRHPLGRVPGS